VIVPLAVATLAACATPGGAAAPAGTTSAGAWTEPADYSFVVTSPCGERGFLGTYQVVVAGGEVVDSQWRDPASGAWAPFDQLESVSTLGDMLEEVRVASEDPEAGEVSLETDPADGHPTSVSVDHIEDAIDDESCYEITDYRPAG
jgi:hypothetical protein